MGSGGIAPPFLRSELGGGEWSALCSCSFTTQTHWIEGLNKPQNRSERCGKKKIVLTLSGIEPQFLNRPAVPTGLSRLRM
jgi:hypothetical protein